ncbi:MAG TPA: type II CAAX endopeptidase family protein [Acidobacteriaceae bacterium]
MVTPPPILPPHPQRPSRLRSFCVFVVALVWAFVAEAIAHRAANGLSSGDWLPLVDRLVMLFLLLVGFSGLGIGFSRQQEPRKAMGLVSRPGLLHEFGTGTAVGWGLLLLTIVPSVFIGGLGATLWTGARQWFLLILDLLVLAIAALCEELIFRGYPFQRLMDAMGTTLASVLISICFVVVHYQPDMPHAAVFALFLLSVILCIAYVRTRAVWLPWGLHFAWNAAMGPLFGLPLSGYGGFANGFSPVVQSTPPGPEWLTGADYGPEGSVIAVLVLCFGLWLILRVTREYASRYGYPEIIPGGIPVDIDAAARRQHEAAMGPSEPAGPKLVQIGDLPPAAAPPPTNPTTIPEQPQMPPKG